MAQNNQKKKHNNSNRNSRNNGNNRKQEVNKGVEVVTYSDTLTVNELATQIGCTASEIIKLLFMLGKMVTINSSLDDETIELVCMEFNKEVKKEIIVDETEFEKLQVEDDPKDLKERPPVVTIMGHVDHGKTTLLDSIRKTKVVEGEFGGITQHIGAYQVPVNGKKVTFLDTPGHEAFTAMRARGASVTDIAIIVVAADDGVMPQTKEAVDHALAAKVPVIVAVNKIDKPGANPDRVMSEMSELGLMPEEWGGSTIYCQVSAKMGQGIKELLETILIVSEVEELKANPNRMAFGSVIEAKLDKGRGPVTTLLIQNGTLKAGDTVVVGTCFGRVRKMVSDSGLELKKAGPSMPVEIIGLNDVPVAGDMFMAFEDDHKARQIAEARLQAKVESERRSSSAMTLDDLSNQILAGDVKEVPIIVKADVTGTAEAVKASLERIDVNGVRVNVIRSTAGAISESDIMLASASKALIYGFNVRPSAQVKAKATEEGVQIRLHNIIYKMLEEVEGIMKGMLAPVFEEVTTGQAEVRQLYKISKVGTVAGCMVTEGSIKKECGVRIIREGVVIYTGKLASLKRFQNDAKEVTVGYDCGIMIENYNDLREGDIFEGFVNEEVSQD
ncbi:MAG: translation initiation factor IF-2 [Erysipelotrichales bacterium]|nr:translation initiation factor IF-2 [Erysipelotrichales bacterium]